jgi:ABC-2 type transport system ATP-binding protein
MAIQLATHVNSLAIEMRAVTKRFGRTHARRPWQKKAEAEKVALAGIDLAVPAGAITGVIGPNGSGKSTLIRILATLTVPDRGTARVFGCDVVEEADQVRRFINRVSVEAAFFKEMSPWENMLYSARLYGGGGGDTRDRVEKSLHRLGLTLNTLDRPMKQLSRGQQQKVAIARSFLTSPSLLLMDEPTTGLDPRSRREVQELVGTLRADHGATVLLSTHDLREAETLCDYVIILERGAILAEGTPAALRARHQVDGVVPSLEDVYLRISGKSLEEDEEEGGEDG